jgi:alkanesulfonate monooxygenase SsuD/methylene tetrahydromethanopterin reductase-like flavin-dependent oxidoreductase (luciferase family)
VTLSQLAPGRITLGVGVGGEDRREIEACGVDPRSRGRRTDEAMTVLRRLLAGDEVTVAGEFFHQDATYLRPVPDPPVPLVVAGRSAAALQRAGRLGDGWLAIWVPAPRCVEAFEIIAAHAEDAGRPPVDWQHGITVWCGFGRDRAEARGRVAPAMEVLYRVPFETFERYTPHGTPAEVAAFVAPYLEAGCATLSFVPHAGSPEAGVEAVAAVRHELGLPASKLATTHTGG